jgi:hypothetical protein
LFNFYDVLCSLLYSRYISLKSSLDFLINFADDVDSWYKLLLLVFILLLNCYFGAFWLKEFIRQKSAEMLKQPFIKKHFSCILQNKLLTKKFKKGGHNVFDFDLKRVEEAKKIMAGSNETKN